MIARTEYGTAEITTAGVVIEADNAQLWAWAHRPNALWPCSALDDFDGIRVEFDSGGLVDLSVELNLAPADDSDLTETRLEELRAELRAEHISWGELAELQELADYIADDDVELLEAAGVKEGERANR